jgi:hypothetical protein
MASISLKYKSKQGSLTAPGDVDPGAMIPIATTTLSTATATVTFSSIPQEYEHLQIRMITRSTNTASTGGDWVFIRFNGDTGSNYTWHRLYGSGASGSADAATSQTSTRVGVSPRDGTTASAYGAGVCDILDYTNTNKYTTQRSLVGNDRNGSGEIVLYSGLWLNTNAITTITLLPEQDNFKQYSSFALYGIKRAGA